jgi:hypothetical protein
MKRATARSAPAQGTCQAGHNTFASSGSASAGTAAGTADLPGRGAALGVGAILLLAGAGWTVSATNLLRTHQPRAATPAIALSSAPVERTDVREQQTVTGTLTYAGSYTVIAPGPRGAPSTCGLACSIRQGEATPSRRPARGRSAGGVINRTYLLSGIVIAQLRGWHRFSGPCPRSWMIIKRRHLPVG